MANSDDSSAENTAAAPPRKQFRLEGPTVTLEPGRFAVRRDLAEIAVADRVFAQHYAEPMAVAARRATNIYARPDTSSDTVADLPPGGIFYLLDLGQNWAWGRSDRPGTTGYVDAGALDLP